LLGFSIMSAPRPEPVLPLYRIARLIARGILGIYFKRIEVSGEEHLAAPGPAIFAANHPQSGADAMVLGLSAGRVVHFVAQSGLFRNPIRGRFLRGVGVVPVHRPRDEPGAAEKNVEMFRACREVLEGEGAIGIFPEGTTRDERRLERLKTGTARIVLETEAVHDFALGVRVVPVGIHFESPRSFRSRVLVRAGNPLRAHDYADAYRRDARSTVERMTADLQAALAAQIVHVEDAELEPLVVEIETVYREALLAKPELSLPSGSRFAQRAVLSGEIAKAVGLLHDEDPESLVHLRRGLASYRARREAIRISDELLAREDLPSFRRAAVRAAVLLLLGFPGALYGAITCGLPYRVTDWILKRKNPDPARIHQTRLGIGVLVHGLYFPLLLVLVYPLLGGWRTILFAASLAPAGLFALAYRRAWIRERQNLRLAWLMARHEPAVKSLRRERRRLMADMDRLLEEYLELREQSGATRESEGILS
jgi:glycerol-3-phosphate O-acyltransferase / dihydroxyacetone phosphate acyltransferase